MINLDVIDEPIGGSWLVIEGSSDQVSIWSRSLHSVEIDLIVADGEGLGKGLRSIIVLHVGKGANGGNQSSESESNTCLHLS